MPFVDLHMFDQICVHIDVSKLYLMHIGQDMRYVLFMLCLHLCVHMYTNVFQLQLVHTSHHLKCNLCVCCVGLYVCISALETHVCI
jgi:hypothetical protein